MIYTLLSLLSFALFIANTILYSLYIDCKVRIDIVADILCAVSCVWLMSPVISLMKCALKNAGSGSRRTKTCILMTSSIKASIIIIYIAGIVSLIVACAIDDINCGSRSISAFSWFIIGVWGTFVVGTVWGIRGLDFGAENGREKKYRIEIEKELISRNAEVEVLNARIREQDDENRRLQGLIPALEGRLQSGFG